MPCLQSDDSYNYSRLVSFLEFLRLLFWTIVWLLFRSLIFFLILIVFYIFMMFKFRYLTTVLCTLLFESFIFLWLIKIWWWFCRFKMLVLPIFISLILMIIVFCIFGLCWVVNKWIFIVVLNGNCVAASLGLVLWSVLRVWSYVYLRHQIFL